MENIYNNIYDIDKIDVLISDGCTRNEAERHLNCGTVVFTPEDFVQSFVLACDDPSEILDDAGCKTLDELLDVCKSGKLRLQDSSNGFYVDGDKSYPYVIVYFL